MYFHPFDGAVGCSTVMLRTAIGWILFSVLDRDQVHPLSNRRTRRSLLVAFGFDPPFGS
jgi:hypothetical protein